jgi:hypothetical protein
VAEHRTRFILKPSNGQGGDGFIMGASCDDEAWQRALGAAQRRPYVVQERITPAPQRFPIMRGEGSLDYAELTWDFNPFVWNGNVAEGALVRAGTESNLSAGTGSVTPVWILDR